MFSENLKSNNLEKEKEKISRPEINFVINPEKDIEIADWRIEDNHENWSDFDQEIKGAASKEEAKQIATRLIKQFYTEHMPEIETQVKVAKESWSKVEPLFFEKVASLFPDFAWPQPTTGREGDEYIAYASILNKYPRYIADKSFSFPADPFSRHYPNIVIAHEMLHFMEYEYLEKKYGLEPSEMGSANNKFWQFTENLNVLIEQGDSWKEIMTDQIARPYKECQELFEQMKAIWDKIPEVDVLIKKIFSEEIAASK